MGEDSEWKMNSGKKFQDMEMVSTSTPIAGTGPGQAIYFTLNAKKNDSGEADLSFVAGKYGMQSNSGDFSAGTFVQGDIYSIEIPGGEMEIPDGTFTVTPADGSYRVRADILLADGTPLSIDYDGFSM